MECCDGVGLDGLVNDLKDDLSGLSKWLNKIPSLKLMVIIVVALVYQANSIKGRAGPLCTNTDA
jgi:hypothetical protein